MLAVLLLASMAGGLPVVTDAPESAERCGRCHRSIHEAWKESAHSRAMESRLFQDALELAETDSGQEARRTCLGCHSPVAARIGDLALKRKVSWEGVTCDYCHSMESVSFNGPNPKAKVEFSLVKSGPIKESQSNGHGTAYSEVHTSAQVCAPCHEFRNAHNFPVLTTFNEWKESRAGREGRACQTCHMYRVSGDVVDPKIRPTGPVKVNLHMMPGSHSIEQLASTIKAQMTTERSGDALYVFVDIANQAAGHYVPTGSPLRQLVLEVRTDTYDGQHFKQQRAYVRRIAGPDGKEIDREDLAFMNASKVIEDTRLAPEERRHEKFTFKVPRTVGAQVKATVWYFYSPLARTEAQKRVTFLTLNRLVK